ncbi:hypothetical protein PGS42_21035 [Yersinia kristensenii]|uniref:hypothetical protein n=1 Tax=Yersinia kristensenii TaxID=28152 RepID=UPI0022FE9011|nr:hypothetical protein [Yersinia kristensenii]MDA5524915.1 hypothetical protein [Yersinia kristensenii]
MQITKEQVKTWQACTGGYRWFLEKFPQGGAYSAVHSALNEDKRFDDARWLVNQMYRTFLGNAEFIKAETDATDKMIADLNGMELPDGESSSGNYARIGSSGNYAQIGSSGNYAQIGSSGNYAQIGSSGNYAQIGSSGNYARIGSSGNYARIGSSGNYARIGSSGNYARIGSSGYNARIGSSGNYAQIGSSGYNARIGSSGYNARIGSSGNYARIEANGKDSVVAAAGSVSRVVLGEGGCAVVPYHDGERTRFAVAYVGENDIKANTPYYINDEGRFVEITEE